MTDEYAYAATYVDGPDTMWDHDSTGDTTLMSPKLTFVPTSPRERTG